MKINYVDAKQILVRNKNPENWFGVYYNMNVYRGCQHDCIYCDSRSECYQIDNFEDLIVKRNAAEALQDALATRRKKVTIGTGSMSDPYIPAEKHIHLTEKCLNVIAQYKYPFHIITKSDLILRDLDLLKEINKTFLSVCFTITTCDEEIATKIEPRAPVPQRRLEAIQTLTEAGIYTGVLFQPILPYLLDTEENIFLTVQNVSDYGGRFIIPWFAVTIRNGQREYFLSRLETHFPHLRERYEKGFQGKYVCNSERAAELYNFFKDVCQRFNIAYKMEDILTYGKMRPFTQKTIFEIDNDYPMIKNDENKEDHTGAMYTRLGEVAADRALMSEAPYGEPTNPISMLSIISLLQADYSVCSALIPIKRHCHPVI